MRPPSLLSRLAARWQTMLDEHIAAVLRAWPDYYERQVPATAPVRPNPTVPAGRRPTIASI